MCHVTIWEKWLNHVTLSCNKISTCFHYARVMSGMAKRMGFDGEMIGMRVECGRGRMREREREIEREREGESRKEREEERKSW